MRKVTAYRGQSLLDVALMACGNAEAAHEIALANGLADDAVLSDRVELIVPQGLARVSEAMDAQGVKPATGENLMLDGIGYMAVESDFIVD